MSKIIYTCEKCLKTFNRSYNYKRHLNRTIACSNSDSIMTQMAEILEQKYNDNFINRNLNNDNLSDNESDNINKKSESYNTKLILNNTPCQFTQSKTKNALKYIEHLEASTYKSNNKSNTHTFNIIITNNSLIEGKQWNNRLNKNNTGKNVAILSSDKKRAHFKTVHDFNSYFTMIDNESELINTLVVCNNYVRMDNINIIIKVFSENRINLSRFGIYKYKFTIMFDEVDIPANLNNAISFINFSKKYDCIDSIHLITATPYKKFWYKLKQQKIESLLNLRHEIIETIPPEKLIENYQSLEKHNIEYVKSEFYSDEFITDIYEKKISKKKYPIRLFAPPSKLTKSHETIKDYFLKKMFIVVIINGKNKDIILPTETLTITEFNKKYLPNKLNVEMYDTLTKLNKMYPENNIVITGFNCIERGITFQTKGFNFTDMIIPPIKDNATSVQILGRANGGKEYVERHNIYIQKEHYKEIKKIIDNTIKLIKLNPKQISENHFIKKVSKTNIISNKKIKKSNEIHIEECKSLSDVKNYIKRKFHINEYKPRRKMKDGFYLNYINKQFKVNSLEEIKQNPKWGLGKNKFKMHICYRDIKEKDTIIYAVCHYK